MTLKKIKIKNNTLKNYGRPFIVAEVGINHNGSLKRALKMIDIAKKSGCDAVKFQTFKADELVFDKKLKFTYFSKGKKISESMNLMFKRNELNDFDWKKIQKYCKQKKIVFFSTPQNLTDLKKLIKLKIPAIKVGSDDFTNIELIKSFLKFDLPTILSTGMSYKKNFEDILSIQNISKKKIIFLLCTSEYPTKHENVHINKLDTIKKIIGNHLIGFSDHTLDNTASILAVSKGCCFFEKHFTLNNNLSGPDHWFSLNPEKLASWVKSIRNAYDCLGKKILVPTLLEKKNISNFKRKIVAKRLIKKGKKILLDDLSMLRTSDKSAYNANETKKIIGKKAIKDFIINEPIKL
jgi:sialic acid synthase SpsE